MHFYKDLHEGLHYQSNSDTIVTSEGFLHSDHADSEHGSTLIVAHVGRNCIGDKSFYVTAPCLWNALLRNIREAKSLTVFKKMLKSHLYPKY